MSAFNREHQNESMASRQHTSDSSASSKLISDALVNYSAFSVASVVGIALIPLMLSHLGALYYGVWLSALTLASVIRAIDFGLALVVMREVAAAVGTRRHARTVPVVKAAGGALLILGSAGAAIIVLGAVFFSDRLRLPEEAKSIVVPVFALVGLAFVAEQGIGFVNSVLTGMRRFGALNLISIVMTLLRAGGIVVLLLFGYSLIPVAIWYAGATVMTAVAAFVWLRSMPEGYGIGIPGRNWRRLRSHLPFGLASFASISTAGLLWQALPLLTAMQLGASAVVSVHIGQKIPLVLTAIYDRLATVVFPAASEYERTNNIAGTQTILVTASRLVLHMMIPVAIVGLLTGPEIIRVWVGNASKEVVPIFRLTLVAVLADALGSVSVNLLWGRGRTGPVLVVGGLSTMMVIGVSILLLPTYGAVGGAATLGLVVAVASGLFWVMASHSASGRPLWFARKTLRGLVIPSLACAVVTVVCYAVPGVPTIPRVVGAAIAGAGAYLWALVRWSSSLEERAFLSKTMLLSRERLLSVGRSVGARYPRLRSLGYLLLSLRHVLRFSTRNMEVEFDRTFATGRDPWGYGEPAQRERIRAALSEIDDILAETRRDKFDCAIEIGCAEGNVTELLAPRCHRLVAVDVSSVALARCRERCAAYTGIEYRQADLPGAAALGKFELVVAMDVLECIHSPVTLRRARGAIVQMLVPGGHVVVTTTRQHTVPETAWWGRWLPIGARINEFVGLDTRLEVVRSRQTSTHAITVYRRTA